MKRQDFYYELPEELIAQDPLEDRSSSRLLVLDKESGLVSHHVFKDITDYLHRGDCLVINDTKVIPARLVGSRIGTDAKIEVLLLKRKENDIWETLVKPGKKAKIGTKISFGEGILTGEVIDVVEEGNRLIQFSYEGIFEEILDRLGQMPLPPISPTSWKTRTGIRLSTPNTAALPRRLRRVFTLPRSFWRRFKKRVWTLRGSRCMWGWVLSGPLRRMIFSNTTCTRSFSR